MVKFKSAEDQGFRKVDEELSIMLKKALRKIEENWEELAGVKHLGWYSIYLPTFCPYISALMLTINIF